MRQGIRDFHERDVSLLVSEPVVVRLEIIRIEEQQTNEDPRLWSITLRHAFQGGSDFKLERSSQMDQKGVARRPFFIFLELT